MLLFTQFLATRAAVGPLLIRITHITSPFLNKEVRGGRVTASKVQGLSVGSWETARWKFQALIETPFGSESRQTISKWFDKYQLVIGHKKILCIIVPNRRTAPLESLLFVFCLLFRLCLKTLVLPLLPNRRGSKMTSTCKWPIQRWVDFSQTLSLLIYSKHDNCTKAVHKRLLIYFLFVRSKD